MSATTATRASPPTFMQEVIAATPGGDPNLALCIQCGTCGGSCPSGPDMDHTPRKLFAMIEAGMREDVLRSNAPWYCVSCYFCTTRCPQEIHITDIMYTLKRMAIQEGYYRESSASLAPDFSETFIDFVEDYGRSFELGLATRYHLRHRPLNAVKLATGMGLSMFLKGRMDLTPNRIENLDQLKAILAKAKELGAAEKNGQGGVS
ncbi:MAG: 4Fe-4S dicluster domain-containing protein [Chloroflexota bacterium]|nr:4Fe-4S dicluster domain-containing protein [Chloroflexota bacterium]